ncbi:MAG TPA: efflux RND transporter periplasmic adaptor subunit [Xanthobacteraceae bacterium]|jgi:multidrug efflux system membrane fusion protein
MDDGRNQASVENGGGPPARRRSVALLIACGAVLVLGGVFYIISGRMMEPSRAAAPTRRAPVPVSIETAARRDLPVYVTGLGTVQAWYTVGIHSQVDGKLQEVLFGEGQRVKKGDVLARIDPRLFQAALDQAKAKKAQDEAMLVAAEKDLTRDKMLITRSAVSEQVLDQQVAKVDQLKASVAADDAAIETAQTQLDYTAIVAPSDGRMGVRLVDPGNIVHASDNVSIATLVLSQPAAVLFTLPVRYLDDVRDAMARGELEVTAFDEDNERPLSTGKLLMIDNQIDQATASFRLKAVFSNQDERLWPGRFVNARLLIETRSNVVVVPSTAVQRGPSGLLAWTVTPEDHAVTRRIEVGPTTGGLTIVTSGLSEGDRVVTGGQYKLQANVPVSITSSPPVTASGG